MLQHPRRHPRRRHALAKPCRRRIVAYSSRVSRACEHDNWQQAAGGRRQESCCRIAGWGADEGMGRQAARLRHLARWAQEGAAAPAAQPALLLTHPARFQHHRLPSPHFSPYDPNCTRQPPPPPPPPRRATLLAPLSLFLRSRRRASSVEEATVAVGYPIPAGAPAT